eukprot:TRINITY_DN8042_c0_g1_i1.p1 TRINITY_DN8042_c0_g1~~TRINITY_DN8042_c0_g1_i1.p1  ORF type:complete len:195 (-),score=36.43 TRINITY_DN8042_c0_g1_i1:103-687(-)
MGRTAVLSFNGEEQLTTCLSQVLLRKGCCAETCFVQEWVDFDFELRMFFLPPSDWKPGQRLEPAQIEWNRWSGFGEEEKPQSADMCSFTCANIEICCETWDGDITAIDSAIDQSIDASHFLLEKLLSIDKQIVPMMRFDFLVRREQSGVARVVFGEYGEMGACCLKWEEGPTAIWNSILNLLLAGSKLSTKSAN